MRVTALRLFADGWKGLLRWRPFAMPHYSQEGEDILLSRIFSGQDSGFYVDVGAHHPRRFSNTYWAYRLGWSGVNIDASPGSRAVFERTRPRDINVEVCVAEISAPVELYTFREPALDTVGVKRRRTVEVATDSHASTVTVQADRLETILERHIPQSVRSIDFMSIDVEGSEMAVLRSNDWSRYRPRVIVIEVLVKSLRNMSQSEEITFLMSAGYVPVSVLYHSVVLIGDDELLASCWPTA